MQHRVSLDWNFANRNFYKTLVIYSDIADFSKSKESIQEYIPMDKNIIDRKLFLNIKGSKEFEEAAQKHIEWCSNYLASNELEREFVEDIYIPNASDPVNIILKHVEENFGALSINVSSNETWKNEPWKKELFTKLPSSCIVFRNNFISGRTKICIPCDLSVITFMQIRIALHMLTRPAMEPYFVHVTNSPEKAQGRWETILKKINLEQKFPLHLLPQNKSVEKTLVEHITQEDYGLLILGKRSGFDTVRRYVFGSVSNALLDRFTDRSVVLVG